MSKTPSIPFGPAVPYSRLSDFTQLKGSGEWRQSRDFISFCDRFSLKPASEQFIDRGLSGYKGHHRKKGAMGRLEEMAERGHFPKRTVIVIEAWDRFSRERPDRAIAHLSKLLQSGLVLGICRLNMIFTEEDFGTYNWTVLSTFVNLAHQESLQKAGRVRDSWAKRREAAQATGQPMTTVAPAWVEVKDGAFHLIPERGAALKRIFELAAGGYGNVKIVQALIKEGVPAFGERVIRDGRKRSMFSGTWTTAYIGRILQDRRALGEYQPKGEGRKPEGPPIKCYFPAAVTEEEFLLARAGREKRRSRSATGPRQRKHLNIFVGLLKNAADGEGFRLHNRKTADNPELVLLNATGDQGRGKCITFPYLIFEKALLRALREVTPQDVFPRKATGSPVDALKERVAQSALQISAYKDSLARKGYSEALDDLLRAEAARHKALKEQLDQELAKQAHPLDEDWQGFRDLAALLDQSKDQEDARIRLRAALQRTVDSIWVLVVRRRSHRLLAVQAYFVEGAHRDFLIAYSPGLNRQPIRWGVRSLKIIKQRGAVLDLRNPKHAQWLAGQLEHLRYAFDPDAEGGLKILGPDTWHAWSVEEPE